MTLDDIEIASRFLEALEAAAQTGDREVVYPFLAPDVEWVTPKMTLSGIDQVRTQLIWGSPPEKLDIEFEPGEWLDLGDGRLAVDVRQVYLVKGTRDLGYERERRLELAVRDGKISRYEMRIMG